MAKLNDGRSMRGKKLVRLDELGPISYSSDGVKFWRDHPFQIVTEAQATHLLGLDSPKFHEATVADVEDYYAID